MQAECSHKSLVGSAFQSMSQRGNLTHVKHLEFSGSYEDEILRLPPQNDIGT
jgi:hypothetical protein